MKLDLNGKQIEQIERLFYWAQFQKEIKNSFKIIISILPGKKKFLKKAKIVKKW